MAIGTFLGVGCFGVEGGSGGGAADFLATGFGVGVVIFVCDLPIVSGEKT